MSKEKAIEQDSRTPRLAGYTLVLIVMACVAGASWSGLYDYGRDTLGWSELHSTIVPISLDFAAIACACLALDSVMKGDGAFLFRTLLLGFVALSAWLNWYNVREHDVSERIFFPAMSLASWLMVEACFRKYQRDAKRRRGEPIHNRKHEPLPWPGIVAYYRHKDLAKAAIDRALISRIPPAPVTAEPIEAIEIPALPPVDHAANLKILDGSKANAIRYAGNVIGWDSPAEIVAWLNEYAIYASKSQVYQLRPQRTDTTVATMEPEIPITDDQLDEFAAGRAGMNGRDY